MRIRGGSASRAAGLAGAIGITLLAFISTTGCRTTRPSTPPQTQTAAPTEPQLYRNVRPLTFAGRRTGEGYFSADGRELVFQSEREPGNPFYQIYRMRLATGETTRVSPGIGRATCGFFHPDGVRVLFASTHEDPEAELAQAIELEKREKGEAARYSWDFDPHYDLYLADRDGRLTALAPAEGYDAEGSVSPDGRLVVFASNRHAYHDALSAEDRDRLVGDPAYFVDLYLLELATGRTRQLTTARGYDGGPFFSPDGRRIVFRRFSEDGARAEILSIDVDGSDERTLTKLGAMSWAPYFHPSGDYVIFATNRHGFDNFELYLVDAAGAREPVRVTDRVGFDGLPVFSPSGDALVWTGNQTEGKKGQLFRADWDDAGARAALRLPPRAIDPNAAAPFALPKSEPEIRAADFGAHVAALTDARTEGRGTGSPGEALAADYVARAMRAMGLDPAGDPGSLRHRFEFSAGIALGPQNRLAAHAEAPLDVDVDWRPLAFSKSGEIPEAAVVFAGYGLVAPAEGDRAAVDEYAGLEVEGRWVMVLRDLPTDLEPVGRQALQRYASLRHKAMIARDRGAVGVIFVNGPRSGFREALAPLRFDAALAGSGLAVVALRDVVVDRWLAASGRSLAALQQQLDQSFSPGQSSGQSAGQSAGGATRGSASNAAPARFELPAVRLGGRVDLETLRSESANIVGRLQVGARPSAQTIVLGAHLDHLGHGEGSGSLADASEAGQIHFGADDNASGVAVLLEIAESLSARRSAGEDLGRRDFVFAAWSGEELGLLGSDRWVDEHVNPHDHDTGPVAYLNFDMVGRLDGEVILHGAGSSPTWAAQIERAALPGTLAIALNDDAYLPTDSTSFYTRGLPILSAFTGIHPEYHTPRDRPELLDAEGAAQIAGLFARLAVELSRAEAPPEFVAQPLPANQPNRGGLRVFLGTIPDYSETDVVGVRLSGVAPGGPAETAGIRGGDTIVEVDGRAIENLYDFTYALEALRVDVKARVTVLRAGRRLAFEVVPRSRD